MDELFERGIEFEECPYCHNLRDRHAMFCEHCSASREICISDRWSTEEDCEEEWLQDICD